MLEGRVAVITGAGRGLGAAIAGELAAQGATVVVADLDEELARATADGLRAAGRVATPFVADVSDAEQVTALFDAVAAEHGRLDVLVNNAGVGAVAPSEELDFEVWSRTLAVNLTGTFLCAQAAARHMLPAGRGVIVNIGSLFAATGMPKRAAYAASKHGVVGLTKVLATEWAAAACASSPSTPPMCAPPSTTPTSAPAATPRPTSPAARPWAGTPSRPRSPASWPSSPPTPPRS